MQQPPSSRKDASGGFLARFDRLCGEINVLLLALAIGLATLDFTCFTVLQTQTAIAQAHLVQTFEAAAPRAPVDLRPSEFR